MIRRASLKGLGKREARQLLDDLCGVGIYRNGFRVRPYGDSDQDWLELDRRRVDDPSTKIGHNQVIGFVAIADEDESDLIERSSREGLEDNGSFRRLKSLLLSLFASNIEPLRREVRIGAGIGSRKPTTYSRILEGAAFDWAATLVQQLPARKRAEARRRVEVESKKLRTQLEELQQRQAQLEANVTLGRIVAEVVHEGRQPTSVIGANVAGVLKDWPIVTSGRPDAVGTTKEAEVSLTLVLGESKRLERLFRLLSPLSGRRRGRPSPASINAALEGVLGLYRERLKEIGVKVDLKVDDQLCFIGYKDDLAISLANLVENSLFWLKSAATSDPTISFVSGVSESAFWLDVSDNGPGIDPRFEGQLFEPGFTTRVEGTGLGLSISREALSRSRGTIMKLESDTGALFRIAFLKRDHRQ